MIWDKVFKNGPSKICGGQPLLEPFLNTFSQMFFLVDSEDAASYDDGNKLNDIGKTNMKLKTN